MASKLRQFLETLAETPNSELPEECILWPFALDVDGYGKIGSARAHRVVMKMIHGEKPPHVFSLHKCGVRACVNPKHLYWGSAKQNAADTLRDGTRMFGENHPLAKLTNKRAVLAHKFCEERINSGSPNPLTETANEFEVTPEIISHLVKGKNWKHLNLKPLIIPKDPEIWIKGTKYSSLREAAKELKMGRKTIKKRCDDPANKDFLYKQI